MTEIQETTNQNSQMEALLSQMSERLQQLEHENNEMHAQNLQYQHPIEQTPSSSRFHTDVRSMPSFETPIETVTNDQITGAIHTPINNQAELNQEEHVTLPVNTARISVDIVQPNVSGNDSTRYARSRIATLT